MKRYMWRCNSNFCSPKRIRNAVAAPNLRYCQRSLGYGVDSREKRVKLFNIRVDSGRDKRFFVAVNFVVVTRHRNTFLISLMFCVCRVIFGWNDYARFGQFWSKFCTRETYSTEFVGSISKFRRQSAWFWLSKGCSFFWISLCLSGFGIIWCINCWSARLLLLLLIEREPILKFSGIFFFNFCSKSLSFLFLTVLEGGLQRCMWEI